MKNESNQQIHGLKEDPIRNEQQNNKNALQYRKQSILSSDLGLGKSTKNHKDKPIPLVVEIKEYDSRFQNNLHDENEINSTINLKKSEIKWLLQSRISMLI
ncbi:unnamed protein product [Paramecium octaurelia]|uniref:Uncharacterized protein n=1 Tax=Paramecium octaurelia TaxID=43137 RepID=A0A8S1Y430_PAROT|nr:unnamed protein product [Paramecium octaurelia]